MYRTQGMLGSPLFNFSSLVGKWVFTASMIIKIISRVFLVSLLGILIITGLQLWGGHSLELLNILKILVTHRGYQIMVAILVIINTRHILFRLKDQDN